MRVCISKVRQIWRTFRVKIMLKKKLNSFSIKHTPFSVCYHLISIDKQCLCLIVLHGEAVDTSSPILIIVSYSIAGTKDDYTVETGASAARIARTKCCGRSSECQSGRTASAVAATAFATAAGSKWRTTEADY